MEPSVKPGRYRHFKGNEYEVLFCARHSETQEEMVVYRALYGERGLWVRPAAMWNETVERDGKASRRFAYIGPADGRTPGESEWREHERFQSAALATGRPQPHDDSI